MKNYLLITVFLLSCLGLWANNDTTNVVGKDYIWFGSGSLDMLTEKLCCLGCVAIIGYFLKQIIELGIGFWEKNEERNMRNGVSKEKAKDEILAELKKSFEKSMTERFKEVSQESILAGVNKDYEAKIKELEEKNNKLESDLAIAKAEIKVYKDTLKTIESVAQK